jgi:Na+-driven multidrug efflux pump
VAGAYLGPDVGAKDMRAGIDVGMVGTVLSPNTAKRWLKAVKITTIAVPIEIALIMLTSSLPNNSVLQRVLIIVIAVPLLPAGAIMDQVFRGPSHDATALVVMIVLGFLIFVVCVWVILTVIEALKHWRRRVHP